MSTKVTSQKASYNRHCAEYRQEALKLASQIGIAKVAKQLSLHESQLYAWRKQSEQAQTVSEREPSLAGFNHHLTKPVDIIELQKLLVLSPKLKRGCTA